MAQTLTKLLVHAVFSIKNREPLIAPSVENELHRYMSGISRNLESPVLTIGGMPDHVHLLISQSKNISIADLMMNIKKDSSKWIKTKGPKLREFAWQEGYGAFTIGESQVDALTKYIATQAEHHKVVSFQDEFRALLQKYGIEYDEELVWG